MTSALPEWSARCRTVAQTQALARAIARSAKLGTVLALDGDLGAGKTTFVQGLAAGWGVENLREVVSPTYALMHHYPAPRGPFVHIDLYRLHERDEAEALGLDQAVREPEGMVAVEWAERMPDLLPANAAHIALHWENESTRRVVVRGLEPPSPWPRSVERC